MGGEGSVVGRRILPVAQEQRSGFEHAVLSYETSTSQFG